MHQIYKYSHGIWEWYQRSRRGCGFRATVLINWALARIRVSVSVFVDGLRLGVKHAQPCLLPVRLLPCQSQSFTFCISMSAPHNPLTFHQNNRWNILYIHMHLTYKSIISPKQDRELWTGQRFPQKHSGKHGAQQSWLFFPRRPLGKPRGDVYQYESEIFLLRPPLS